MERREQSRLYSKVNTEISDFSSIQLCTEVAVAISTAMLVIQ
ncbi:hypothetical protein NIES37_27450 [Tolypothrix tenuis PCC 7101]|uniref:Uncharacterized protein n=1 Tax=Tolypothrix tenuis PCC 7101 TaxID=231146 RepID=A0A1Z4MZC5_9CYAN|nr:hypothetical protein NIES37_27450 [Tolypothrix tenuis PCC 7101]BAZ77289.1 hypothetical protein NIES50_59180 [Aulosira laxa NIES-50]